MDPEQVAAQKVEDEEIDKAHVPVIEKAIHPPTRLNRRDRPP